MAKWPVLCVLSTLIAASGCGDDGRAQMAPPNSNSGGGTPVSSGGTEKTDSGTDDAGRGETGGMSETGGMNQTGGMNETGGAMDPDGGVPDGSIDAGGFLDPARLFPVVSFLSPDAATVHDSPDVVTDRTITVRCAATASEVDGGLPVKEDTVAITMLASINADPFTSAAADTKGVVDKVASGYFESSFNLEGYPNGALAFMCSAGDTASPANEVETELETLLDLGPIIQIESPLSGSILALKRPVFVTFSATESPLLDPDSGAEIESVTLEVLGARRTIELAPGAETDQFTASIDFDDPTLFDAAPATAELVFRATNKRAAGPVTRTERINITLDGVGPELTVESPAAGIIINGEVIIRLEATDPSGVALDRLVARIPDPDSPNGVMELTDWNLVGGEYTHRFDTNALAEDRNQVLINFSAFDSVGNESTLGLPLVLDNQPPLVSLDPPNIREYYVYSTVGTYCTLPFNPVGDDTLSDLDIAEDGSALFRAIAWDQTNSKPGTVDYYATTQEDDVILFARLADGVPLVINSAGQAGGRCNEIATDPLGPEPYQWPLDSLKPGGHASLDVDDPFRSSLCAIAPPNTLSGSTPRCGFSQLSRVTTQNPILNKPLLPGVFAFAPDDKPDAPACDGNAINLASQLGTGWVCVAVRATDEVGNIGISAPLRIWVETAPDDYPGIDSAPSCTDGCIPPSNLPEGRVYFAQ